MHFGRPWFAGLQLSLVSNIIPRPDVEHWPAVVHLIYEVT